MDALLYFFALGFVKFLQLWPLPWVARLGRCGGALAFSLDKRHRNVTIQNLTQCFGHEKSAEEIQALAKENFRRLGENYCSAIKTAAMSSEQLKPHISMLGVEEIMRIRKANPNQNWVIAIGHFGNFELYARFRDFVPGLRMATTYRGLKQPSLNRLMQNLREKSGCLFFERRSEGGALRAAMSEGNGMMLGLLADQHAGNGGYWAPFFGKECSTTTAPAVFALRYNCQLYTGFVFRNGLASWRLELGDKIETHENGVPRSTEAITDDINRSYEKAIRRDPANWFWVHKRWKPKPGAPPKPAAPPAMQPERILIRGVNWLGDAVMTTPALQRLHEAHPKASITMLAPSKLADLWLHHPCLDGVIPIQPKQGLLSIARTLRREKFDTAIVFPNSPRSALEVFLARIPNRIGYARAWRNWFLTNPLSPNPSSQPMRKRSEQEIRRLIQEPASRQPKEYSAAGHHVHHYLRIVGALGADLKPVPPQIGVTTQEMQAVTAKWNLGNAPAPWFGLNPGAEYGPAKRWPAERFSAAAIALSQRTGCRWLIFGAKGDVPIASRIAQEIQQGLGAGSAGVTPPVLNLAGQTSLRDLCALLRCCGLVITNDSGPMHLAAAVGTPIVALFGSTSPELTGPGLGSSASSHLLKTTAPCAPCFLRECPIDFRCMREHTVDKIVQTVLRIHKIRKNS